MHSLLLLISAGALALLGFSDPVSARPARPWHCEPWSGGAIAIAPLGVQGSETSACFAEDGVNCRHFASVDECKSSSLPAPSPGNTKFCTDSSDFCGLAVLRASNRFFCVPGVSTPVQVVGGDNLACLADDSGKACVWDGDCKTAGRFSGHGSKFLTCGSKTYFNKFGDYGYDNPDSWCCQAYEAINQNNPKATWQGARPYPFKCKQLSGRVKKRNLFVKDTMVTLCNNITNSTLKFVSTSGSQSHTVAYGECAAVVEDNTQSTYAYDLSAMIMQQFSDGSTTYVAEVTAQNPYFGPAWMTVQRGLWESQYGDVLYYWCNDAQGSSPTYPNVGQEFPYTFTSQTTSPGTQIYSITGIRKADANGYIQFFLYLNQFNPYVVDWDYTVPSDQPQGGSAVVQGGGQGYNQRCYVLGFQGEQCPTANDPTTPCIMP